MIPKRIYLKQSKSILILVNLHLNKKNCLSKLSPKKRKEETQMMKKLASLMVIFYLRRLIIET